VLRFFYEISVDTQTAEVSPTAPHIPIIPQKTARLFPREHMQPFLMKGEPLPFFPDSRAGSVEGLGFLSFSSLVFFSLSN